MSEPGTPMDGTTVDAVGNVGLIASAPDESTREIERLFREHAASIRGVVIRLAGPNLEWDDLLQDVFMVAIRNPGFLRQGIPPRLWLRGIAVRVVASARRRAALRRMLGLERAPEPSHLNTPERAFTQLEATRQLYS